MHSWGMHETHRTGGGAIAARRRLRGILVHAALAPRQPRIGAVLHLPWRLIFVPEKGECHQKIRVLKNSFDQQTLLGAVEKGWSKLLIALESAPNTSK